MPADKCMPGESRALSSRVFVASSTQSSSRFLLNKDCARNSIDHQAHRTHQFPTLRDKEQAYIERDTYRVFHDAHVAVSMIIFKLESSPQPYTEERMGNKVNTCMHAFLYLCRVTSTQAPQHSTSSGTL